VHFTLIYLGSHSFLLRVVLGIELPEHDEEHDHIGRADGRLCDGVAAVVVDQQEAAVAEDGYKLYHLEHGEVALPPEILLEARAKSGKEVVGVHDHVHKDVEQSAKGLVTTRDKSKR
jgi:hypothetical protein